MPANIDIESCNGCGLCDDGCPGDVIHMSADGTVAEVAYPDECWHCGICRMDCPTGAVTYVFPREMLV